MLKFFWKARRSERGFTLIELVVVLAILGILIALAVPRYLGARRNALVAEGDNVLQEIKTLAWAYYQQYSDWSGITAGGVPASFGFTAPGGGCWTYNIPVDSGAAIIEMQASGAGAGGRCSPLGAAGAATVNLTLNGDGSSSRSQVLP